MADDNTTAGFDIEKFFSLSLDLLCIADTSGAFKRINPAFTEVLGWTQEELLSRPCFDFIHPDDIASTSTVLDQLALGQPTLSFENRFRERDGGYRWLSWRAFPDPITGLLYATARDVTERKRLEQEIRGRARRFEALLHSVVDAVITIAPDGTVDGFNDAAERIFGYPADLVLGRNVSMLMGEDHAAQHDGYIAHYLQTGEQRVLGRVRELQARRADGTLFPIELRVSAFNLDGEERYVGTVSDISERHRLQQAQDHVRALNTRDVMQQGRIETATGMLHDLGNALTGIGGRLVDVRSQSGNVGAIVQLERTVALLEHHNEAIDVALEGRAALLLEVLNAIVATLKARAETAAEDLGKAFTYVAHRCPGAAGYTPPLCDAGRPAATAAALGAGPAHRCQVDARRRSSKGVTRRS